MSKRLVLSPMVLLSAVDHYKRVNSPRVVGILLGKMDSDTITISNSFAIPFEESEDLYFVNTSYLINMFGLFQKVNKNEIIVGWYHTGPELYKNDVEISKTISKFVENPLLAVINVCSEDFPVQMFSLEKNVLKHKQVFIGAEHTEEVAIEHLLRDIKKGTGKSLLEKTHDILSALKSYKKRLDTIIEYLNSSDNDHKIISILQEIVDMIPKVEDSDLSNIYHAEMFKSLIAFNDVRMSRLNF